MNMEIIDQSLEILPIDKKDEVEMGLRTKQFDYILYYAKQDEKRAREILNKLQPLDGVLFDEELPFKTWKYSTELKKRNDLFLRSTFKFFVVTDNLADDYEFILEKNNAVENDLKKRDQSIIPLWVTPKRKLIDDAFDTLHGFTSLQGLDPNNADFKTRVETMANMPMFAGRKAERERIQKSKLTGYLQDKQQKIRSNGKSKGQKRTNGDIHIHVNGEQIQGPKSQCFIVPVEYWLRFKRRRDNQGTCHNTGSYSSTSQSSNSMGISGSYDSDMTVDGGSSNSTTPMNSVQPSTEDVGHSDMYVDGGSSNLATPTNPVQPNTADVGEMAL